MAKEKKPPTPEPSVDEMIAGRRFELFWPNGKEDLIAEYPEFRNIKEFIALSTHRQMLFVYFLACKCSPAREFQDFDKRIDFALKAVWGKRIPQEIDGPYRKRDWGEQIDLAIMAMRAFEIGPRLRHKMLFLKKSKEIERLIDDTDAALLVTPDQKLAHIKMVGAGLDLLAKMHPFLEEKAFGVVEKEVGGDDDLEEGEFAAEMLAR